MFAAAPRQRDDPTECCDQVGSTGPRGEKGEQGASGPTIHGWLVDREHYRVSARLSDGTIAPPLEL